MNESFSEAVGLAGNDVEASGIQGTCMAQGSGTGRGRPIQGHQECINERDAAIPATYRRSWAEVMFGMREGLL